MTNRWKIATNSRSTVTLVSCVFLAVVGTVMPTYSQTVTLLERDAVRWSRQGRLDGRISGASSGVLYQNGLSVANLAGDSFQVEVVLAEGDNQFVACIEGDVACSDTVTWTLGYRLRPDVFAYATVLGRSVQLVSEVVQNPFGTLAYEWAEDPENPQPLSLGAMDGPTTEVTVPTEAEPGEYYFDLGVSVDDSVVARARTFVTVTSDSIRAFNIDHDHAAWIDEAVLYEVAPWYFGRYRTGQQLRMIADKIPEISSLGVTGIWLQPVTQTFRGGQGYDVIDYFKVWDEIGTEDDLRHLVETAHTHGLKVLLDIVLNHSSLYHPYARDAAEHGAGSYYFDFYQRVSDGAPYSSNYTTVRDGRMSFLTYFWPELVNFNYASAEVERFITEASRYWVEEFDIDGYRFDAVWGVHARDPDFTRSLRRSLKRIKPEVLLLAEAKAPYSAAFPDGFPSVFESFDAAYDWTDSAWCISYWALARECLYSAYEGGDQNSLFNSGSSLVRSSALRAALTNRGRGFPNGAKILRFLENNDVPRFLAHHPLEATRMAATLLFSLTGIPMLYYGQESGMITQWPTFSPSRTIRSYDAVGLWPFYQYLIDLRHSFPSLTSDYMEEVPVEPPAAAQETFAYHRWDGVGEHIVAVINMGDASSSASLDMSPAAPTADSAATVYLTDLLTGDVIQTTSGELTSVTLALQPYAAALYAVADSVVNVPVRTEGEPRLPGSIALAQNYPNPYRQTTTIEYTVERSTHVRLRVFDVVGRLVAEPVNAFQVPGRHRIRFDGRDLPSGVYLYRLHVGDSTSSRTMTRVR